MASFSMTGLLECETDQLDLGLGPLSGYRRISYTTLNALSAIRRNLVKPAFEATSRIAASPTCAPRA
jgi:hypothetical protein